MEVHATLSYIVHNKDHQLSRQHNIHYDSVNYSPVIRSDKDLENSTNLLSSAMSLILHVDLPGAIMFTCYTLIAHSFDIMWQYYTAIYIEG